MATTAATTFSSFQLRRPLLPPLPFSSTPPSPLNSRSRIPAVALRSSEKHGIRRDVIPSSSTDDRVELDENPEGIISGEWPENFSLLSYNDLRAYLEPQILKEQMKPSSALGEVMTTLICWATPDQALEEIDKYFEEVSGLPVVDDDMRCIGIVSKKDKEKASEGLKSKVSEVMSSPPITLTPDKTVIEAAALMLKHKIHRIPILNEESRVIGMVTRTDIFHALELVEV